jgi:predicted RNase H-like HicB family nuclease
MTGKVSVVIEQDEQGCYAWCPELKGCQSQGNTVEETLVNIPGGDRTLPGNPD